MVKEPGALKTHTLYYLHNEVTILSWEHLPSTLRHEEIKTNDKKHFKYQWVLPCLVSRSDRWPAVSPSPFQVRTLNSSSSVVCYSPGSSSQAASAFNLSINWPFRVKLAKQIKNLAVIKSSRGYLVIKGKFSKFSQSSSLKARWSAVIVPHATLLSCRQMDALCVRSVSCVVSSESPWSGVSHWICYGLCCWGWFLSFVDCCMEAGLSALVDFLFTLVFSTLPWPLFHFQHPEKTRGYEPWPSPDPHPLSVRKPNTCLNN